MSVRVAGDVLDVLRDVECDGVNVRITGQLDRAMYQKVAKVLAALGGKWNRSAQATVFPEEAAPLIADAVATGEYVDAKKQYQFYETPPAVVDAMLELAGIRFDGLTVLEPSAGHGAIALAVEARGGDVDCVEMNPAAVNKLMAAKLNVLHDDFLRCEAGVTVGLASEYDAVLMNPPFCPTPGASASALRSSWPQS